jgi:hypothetical protein
LNFPVCLILLGYILEILGAFVLAAQAIGLNRLSQWINSLTRIRAELSGDIDPTDSIIRPGVARIIFASICAVGAGIGSYYGSHPPKWAATFPTWAARFGAPLIGALVGVVLYRIILVAMKLTVNGLLLVESRTRRHASGILGFIMLLIGFILQFSGTLGDSLARIPR